MPHSHIQVFAAPFGCCYCCCCRLSAASDPLLVWVSVGWMMLMTCHLSGVLMVMDLAQQDAMVKLAGLALQLVDR
jgi:hypothetical protein